MLRDFFSKVGDYIKELKDKNEQLQFENEVLKRDRRALLERVYALSAENEQKAQSDNKLKATFEQLKAQSDNEIKAMYEQLHKNLKNIREGVAH